MLKGAIVRVTRPGGTYDSFRFYIENHVPELLDRYVFVIGAIPRAYSGGLLAYIGTHPTTNAPIAIVVIGSQLFVMEVNALEEVIDRRHPTVDEVIATSAYNALRRQRL